MSAAPSAHRATGRRQHWGAQRLGVNLISRIATLREEGRLPIRSIQWYLRNRPSAEPQRGGHRERHSPDRATGPTSGGWDGGPHPRQPSGPRRRNRLASEWEQWLRVDFQHPHRALLPAAGSGQGGGGRSAGRVVSPECWSAISTLPTTITMAPSNGAGPTCCGTSTTWWRSTPRTPRWPSGPRQSISSMSRPGLSPHPQARRRRTAQLAWERQLLAICQPFLADPSAVQGKLCRRIERHIKELFVFVAEPDVPADNNPAERSLRHLVISRKVSGGTRSEQGTESKMTLASIFGTWRAQGLNPLAACRQLLTSPQV